MKNSKKAVGILILIGICLVALLGLYFVLCAIFAAVNSFSYIEELRKTVWIRETIFVSVLIYSFFLIRFFYKRKLYFEIHENADIVNRTLASGYDSISIIDINTREVQNYKRKSEFQKISKYYHNLKSYDEMRRVFADEFIYGDDKENFLAKTDINYILKQLENKWSLRVNYRIVIDGNILYYGTRFLKENIDKVDRIIYATRNMNMDVQEEIEKSLKISSALKEAEVYKHAIFSSAKNCFECDIDNDTLIGDYYDVVDGKLIPTSSFKSLPHPLRLSLLNNYIADNYLLSGYEEFKTRTSREYLSKCFNNGNLNPELDFEAKDKKGGKVFYHIEFFLSRDMTSKHLKAAVVVTDNTSKKENENILLEKNLAEAQSKAKSEFFASMSHDLSTPIGGIVNIAYELKNEVQNDALIDKINNLIVTSKHLETMIDNISNLNKTESDQLESVSVPFDFDEIISDVVEMTKGDIEPKSISFNVNAKDVVDKSLYGDALHLKQVIMNLVKNSCKYVDDGGSIHLNVNEIKSAEKIMLNFEIVDDGPGLPSDILEHIFDPYSEQAQIYNSDYLTTGLNIILTKKYVEAMDGSISYDSVNGKGTVFSFVIPFEIDNPIERKNKEDEMALSGIRILFAEDNDATLRATREMLEDSGCIVMTCRSGKEAYDIFSTSEPLSFDCILMDLQMPVMNGIEAATLIRTLNRADAVTTPIIGLTSDTSSEVLNDSIEAGMDARLIKPFEKGQLVKVLLTCMHARSMNLVNQLESTMSLVNRDALTGVKNAQAYKEEIENLNSRIRRGERLEFAIVYCDVNDLKKTNDTIGHNMGDELIKNACKYMCDIFKHSPVFRIGGDEFVIILRGADYIKRDSLIKQCAKANKEHVNCTFAYGMSSYLPMNDSNCQSIIRRADSAMYECKKNQKASKKQ